MQDTRAYRQLWRIVDGAVEAEKTKNNDQANEDV